MKETIDASVISIIYMPHMMDWHQDTCHVCIAKVSLEWDTRHTVYVDSFQQTKWKEVKQHHRPVRSCVDRWNGMEWMNGRPFPLLRHWSHLPCMANAAIDDTKVLVFVSLSFLFPLRIDVWVLSESISFPIAADRIGTINIYSFILENSPIGYPMGIQRTFSARNSTTKTIL